MGTDYLSEPGLPFGIGFPDHQAPRVGRRQGRPVKAMVYDRYGGPAVIRAAQVPLPEARDGQVLVRVRAASINSWDWDLLIGRPMAFRLFFGLRRPRYPIMGSDIAGTVEAIGNGVSDFKAGDDVFGDVSGDGFGAFAEYACITTRVLAHKPRDLTFETAAALPQAGSLALQALRLGGEVQAGQHVLVNGAGGGVGTLAIQLAKIRGAHVTAVDHPSKRSLLLELGADRFLDYTSDDFTTPLGGKRYDRIVDNVATRRLGHYRRVLNDHGVAVIVGGRVRSLLSVAACGRFAGRTRHTRLLILPLRLDRDDLVTLGTLCVSGQLTPVIDRVLPLDELATGLQRLGEGRVKGKVIVRP